jgi:molybdopterin molybdotransferase
MNADWLSVAEAREAILAGVDTLPTERLPLLSALGRVLAEELVAPLDLPPWDNSGMDGFAVRGVDVRGASDAAPKTLRVIDDIPAGGFPARALEPGTASRVMTGAPVPEGADGVIRVEHTDGGALGGADPRVTILSDADAGRNVRRVGEDLRRGDRVLESGRVVRSAEIGVAASLGRSQLSVIRRPVVGILTSGDELVDVDGFADALAGRRIVSSNGYSLAAQLAESGIEARVLGIASDTPESVREHLLRARGCDALVSTAGISVGAHDYVREVLLALGLRTAFWRVRMRPGSPVAFGWIDELGGIPWFGLPGNPVSCMVTFELFVRPALLRMAGRRAVFLPTVRARLADDYRQPTGLTHFARVRLATEPDGSAVARLTGAQGSGILTSMAGADGLMVVPEDRGAVPAGESLSTLVLGGAPLREVAGY